MRITRIEIFDLQFDEAPTWHPIILRAHTDAGLSGLGEVGLAYGVGHSAGADMARELAEGFALGADPFRTEWLWDEMFRKTFWAQGGGPVVFGGMSAIDMACWDLKAQALGVPVYQLLGGKTNERLRTYASQIQFGWGPARQVLTTPEEYAEVARATVAEGYDCVKIDPVIFDLEGNRAAMNLRGVLPPDKVRLFRERIAAVREAVGPDVDIILELHSFLGTPAAIQLGQAWEEFACFYYEEPVHYLNMELHNLVARNVKIPTAAGERIYTRWGYREYFEKQALAVIQPDLGLVGGLSEGKKICDYAHVYDITVQAHVCGSPVATAAALHLEAAIPNFLIHEHHTNAIKPYNRMICEQDLQPDRGQFAIPDAPGLGVTLNERLMARMPRVVVE
ncbi:MAG: mandelate racemase/muconate lactonizing enzyme family protein [Anaerolineae bacterium]|nr:mandelate racemase/muconate lactonizing enzyme family protein [Anaerolineae bacterium]